MTKIRPIRIEGDVAYVTLTRGYTAIIDATDVPLVDGGNWNAKVELRADGSLRAVYAKQTFRGQVRLMHRDFPTVTYWTVNNAARGKTFKVCHGH